VADLESCQRLADNIRNKVNMTTQCVQVKVVK